MMPAYPRQDYSSLIFISCFDPPLSVLLLIFLTRYQCITGFADICFSDLDRGGGTACFILHSP